MEAPRGNDRVYIASERKDSEDITPVRTDEIEFFTSVGEGILPAEPTHQTQAQGSTHIVSKLQAHQEEMNLGDQVERDPGADPHNTKSDQDKSSTSRRKKTMTNLSL